MYFHYLPKYVDLDYIYEYFSSYFNCNQFKLNLFFDFKNGIFVYDENSLSEDNKQLHLEELLITTLKVINYIRNYFKDKYQYDSNNINFIFYCEIGKSLYHRRIDREYKSNRIISDDFIRTEDFIKQKIIHTGSNLLETSFNTIKNVYFYKGEFFEYDFIPYYFIKKFCDKSTTGNVIFSSDKDNYQLQILLKEYEILQLEKMTTKSSSSWHPGKLFINKKNVVKRFFRKCIDLITNENEIFLFEYFNLMRAILGDSGDGIKNVKGISYNTLLQWIVPFFKDNFINMNEIYDLITKYTFDFFESLDEENKKTYPNIKHMFLMNLDTKDKKIFKRKVIQNFLLSQSRILKNIALMDYKMIYEMNKDKFENKCKEIENLENKLYEPQDIYLLWQKIGIIKNRKVQLVN